MKLRSETWEALESLYEEKKVRNIGVSNYYVKHLKSLLEKCNVKPVINQIELHPLCIQWDTVEFCRENKIVVEAYCSLAQHDPNLIRDKTIVNLAKKYKKSESQICLKWALQNEFVIPRSKNPNRVKENCDIFDFEIEGNDMELINGMNIDYHVDWDPNSVN